MSLHKTLYLYSQKQFININIVVLGADLIIVDIYQLVIKYLTLLYNSIAFKSLLWYDI